MAMTPFIPVPNESTHSDVRVHFNNNFSDAESRVSILESLGLAAQYGHQTPASNGGALVFDVSSGYNGKITLTEDTALAMTGASAGGSGIIMIEQDATGGWNLTSGYRLFAGLLTDIPLLAQGGANVISVSWYFDGNEYFLWVSDISSIVP